MSARRDDAVSSVLGAILVLAGLVAFFAMMNTTWAPVIVGNTEARRSQELQEEVRDWLATADDHVARGLLNQTLQRTLPMGSGGWGVTGRGASSGSANLSAAGSANVYLSTSLLFSATGTLSLHNPFTQVPEQTLRLVGGGLEVNQTETAWADPRSMVTAQRGAAGLNLTIHVLGLNGAPQAQGGTRQLHLEGTVSSAATTTHASGTVELRVDGVSGAAWRAGLNRTLALNALVRQDTLGCTGLDAATDYCFATDTNDADTAHVYFANVATGWTLVRGTLDLDLST